jgi:hypothetical protein
MQFWCQTPPAFAQTRGAVSSEQVECEKNGYERGRRSAQAAKPWPRCFCRNPPASEPTRSTAHSQAPGRQDFVGLPAPPPARKVQDTGRMLLLLVSAAGSYRLMVTILSAAALVAGEGAEEGPPSSGSCNVKAGGNPVYAPVCAAAKTEAACAKLSETCTWVPPRVKPVDTDCMHWVKVTDSGDGTPLYVPARDGGLLVVGWQNGPSWDPGSTERIGTQVICASLYGQLGHFDFDGQGSRPNRCYVKDMSVGNGSQVPPPFYIATFARANLTWSTFNSGDNPPTNAYQLDGDYLGRTLGALQSPSQSAMPGWVAKDGAKLGAMHYEDFGAHDINQFQLATCHPPTRLGYVCSNATNLCVAQNFSGTGSWPRSCVQDHLHCAENRASVRQCQ